MKPLGFILIVIAGFTCIVLSAFVVMTAGTFRDRLHYHTQNWEKAKVYISSPHCREGGKRSKLGEFQLCDKSEKILSSTPAFHALVDVSKTLPPMLAKGVSAARQDLHRIVLTVGAAAIVWMWIKKYTTPQPTTAWDYPSHTLPMWKPRSLPTFSVVHDY